jgi:hypothetical protein
MRLRWKIQSDVPNSRPVLQFWQRESIMSELSGLDYSENGRWVNVPVVIEPSGPGETPSCCDGGNWWGHHESCPNVR